ncbi:hypothetical protein TI10_08520 [Photorhabdus luminescens subsp. luminescens]|uniref:Uncharacterized protein n=1 Tax=Photorhabdus luminescens TaxID=29488 RepID=A0A1G5RBA2_PHOLU|nr:hypothetical protein [Photorhabdus luminescens]KMW73153.1 hypothetical protein TI10_08520 [Photorhabdus luminescens subsp. luminescens]SCZ71128.1 hypothetical protein SAMN02982990_03663 [Photorhabdus luminescens]
MLQINEKTMSREPVKLEGMKLEFESGNVETGIRGPDNQSGVRYNLKFKLILNFDSFIKTVQEKLPYFFNDYLNNVRPELGGFAYYVSNFPIGHANYLKEKKDLHDFLIRSSSWITDWAESVGTGYLIKYEKPSFSLSPDDNELYINASKSFIFSDVNKTFEVKDIPLTRLDWALYLRDEIEDDGIGGELNLAYYPNETVDIDGSRLYRGQLYLSGKHLTPGVISPEQIKVAK